MVPVFLFFAPANFTVRSLPVKNMLPSQLVAKLATSGFSREAMYLAANNRSGKLIVSGPSEVVDDVVQVVQWADVRPQRMAFQIEAQEPLGGRLKGQIELENNEKGLLILKGQQQHKVHLVAHLNGDKTITLLVTVESKQARPGTPTGVTEVGMTAAQRFSPTKPLELRAPVLRSAEGQRAYLPLRVTASVKK